MTFEQWRTSIEKHYLVQGTDEWRGFQAWLEHLEGFRASAARSPNWDPKLLPEGHPFKDPKRYILRKLYNGTLLPTNEDVKRRESQRKKDEKTLEQLADLTTRANKLVKLATHDLPEANVVTSQDGDWTIDLTPLLRLYEDAAENYERAIQSSREVLWILQAKHVQAPDIIDHCLGLIVELKKLRPRRPKPGNSPLCVSEPPGERKRKSRGISEKQALALVYVALLAHGHDADDLDILDPENSRWGNVRRRVDTRTRRVIAVADRLAALVRKK